MDAREGDSALAGADRWEGGSDAFSRIDVNVRAFRSGVDPRTDDSG
jgi:hypothetical protein